MFTKEEFEAFLAGLDLPVPPSLYQSLPPGPYFRVVRFHKLCPAYALTIDERDLHTRGDDEETQAGSHRAYITCSLVVRKVDEDLPYAALSYRCVTKQAENRLLLDGHTVSVMQTVWDFVHQEMQRGHCPDIFIDSLCISPFDLQERSAQVQLMASIYSNASLVYVWLGEQVCCTDTVLSMWHRAKQAGTGLPPLGQAMHHLFGKDYWSRGWVVQEFVLAKNVKIRCGREYLDISVLRDFFESLVAGDIKQMNKVHAPEFFAMPAHKIFRQRETRTRKPLAKVLVDNRKAACTDIRDKVYAFLGLATDVTPEHAFPVDYSDATTPEVLLHNTLGFCSLHPDSTLPFCHYMRDSFGLSRSPPTDAGKVDTRVLSCTAWNVGTVEGLVLAEGSTASPDSFRICHAAQRARKMEVTATERHYLELQIESAELSRNDLPPATDDSCELDNTGPLVLLGSSLPSLPSFGTAGFDLLAKLVSEVDWPQLTKSTPSGSIRRYSCKREVRRQNEAPDNCSMLLLTACEPQAGDIVCQFLGVRTSLLIRNVGVGGMYIPVGKAYLEDEFHQNWMGSSWEHMFTGDPKPHWLAKRGMAQLQAINMVVPYSALPSLA